MLLKAIFVDQPARASPALDQMSSNLLQRSAVAVLAGIVLLLGIMPNTLTARILAAMPNRFL